VDDLVLVDVGASGGIHRRWADFTPHLTAFLFEPDEAAYRRLTSRAGGALRMENAAVLGEPGMHAFHVCKKQEASSVLYPNPQVINLYPDPGRFEIVSTQQVVATSLDRHFLDGERPQPHFIKLDTQGSELSILQGGKGVLATTVGVEVETWYVPVYQAVPLFPEVDQFIRSLDFQAHDFVHFFWKRAVPRVAFDSSLGDLVSAEVLYFKAPESLLELIGSKVLTLTQAVCCYLAYGYTHLSQVLLEMASSSVVGEAEKQDVRSLIRRFQKPGGLSRLPGASVARWRLAHLNERLFPHGSWVSKSKADLGSRYGIL
jgi:FkbM family methyltransferase